MVKDGGGAREEKLRLPDQRSRKIYQLLKAANRRRRIRAVIDRSSFGVMVGISVGLLLVLCDRFFAPDWLLLPMVLGSILAGPLIAVLSVLFFCRFEQLDTVIEVERRQALKQRLSSALFVEEHTPEQSSDDLVELVIADGDSHAELVDLTKAIPISVPRTVRASLWLGGLLLVCWWAMPPFDLLGNEELRAEQEAEEKRIEKEDQRLQERSKEMLELAKRHQISPETKKLLADLEKSRPLPKTEELKEQTRRPLAALEELKKRAQVLKARPEVSDAKSAVRSMQAIESRMETSLGQEAREALSQGSPQRAAEALQKLAKKLADAAQEGELAEQESLARDLEKLQAALGSELSAELSEALSKLKAGDLKGAASTLGENAEELAQLARLMREANLLDQIESEIQFTQDELAQLPQEWKSGPPPKICPDCLNGT